MNVKKIANKVVLAATLVGSVGGLSILNGINNSAIVSAATIIENYHNWSIQNVANATIEMPCVIFNGTVANPNLGDNYTWFGQFKMKFEDEGLYKIEIYADGEFGSQLSITFKNDTGGGGLTQNGSSYSRDIEVGSSKELTIEVSGANYSLETSSILRLTPSVQKEVEVTSDESGPVISGYEGAYITNIDNPISVEEVKAKLSAKDAADGDVEVNIVEGTDNYSSNKNKLGTYSIKFEAIDSSNNRSEITVSIKVVDIVNPIISGETSYVSNMSNPLTVDSIKSMLEITDNYNTSTDIVVEVIDDEFTGNENIKGSYSITYKAIDSSTNESEPFTVTVNVVDDVKPVIEGANNYNVSYQESLLVENIRKRLTVTDNVDELLTIKVIEDNYTSKSSIPGTYTIKFSATDSSGNVSDPYVVTITVYDNIPPVFWVTNDIINIDIANRLTHAQLIEILLTQQGIEASAIRYEVLEDTYSENYSKAGVYSVSYNVELSDGEIVPISTTINVIENETEVNDTETQIKQRTDNLFEKLLGYVKMFFIKLGKSVAWAFTFGKINPNWSNWEL